MKDGDHFPLRGLEYHRIDYVRSEDVVNILKEIRKRTADPHTADEVDELIHGVIELKYR